MACGGERTQRMKRRKIFGEGKYLDDGGEENREGKGGKYLEKENIWSREDGDEHRRKRRKIFRVRKK